MTELPYVPPPEKDDSAEGFVRGMVLIGGILFVVLCCLLPIGASLLFGLLS